MRCIEMQGNFNEQSRDVLWQYRNSKPPAWKVWNTWNADLPGEQAQAKAVGIPSASKLHDTTRWLRRRLHNFITCHDLSRVSFISVRRRLLSCLLPWLFQFAVHSCHHAFTHCRGEEQTSPPGHGMSFPLWATCWLKRHRSSPIYQQFDARSPTPDCSNRHEHGLPTSRLSWNTLEYHTTHHHPPYNAPSTYPGRFRIFED